MNIIDKIMNAVYGVTRFTLVKLGKQSAIQPVANWFGRWSEDAAWDWYSAEQDRLDAEREEADWQQFVTDEEARMEQLRLDEEEQDRLDAEREEADWQQFVTDEEAKIRQQRLDAEEWERSQAEHDAWMDSRCIEHRCYEDAGPDGYCTAHEYLNNQDDDPYDQYPHEEEICPGICGQPANCCTCAETKSFRDFHADPATRGSYWTA